MIMISILDIEHKKQHSHAQALLKECLGKCGVDYDETMTAQGEYGKPYLPDYPHIHYNLSHASGIAACMAAGKECGIDCEKIRPTRTNVMRRAFSEIEKALVENAPESERDLMFTRLWTLKEAYGKAIGKGINYSMNVTDFSFNGGEITTAVAGYRFRQYIIKGEYIVSTCLRDVDI